MAGAASAVMPSLNQVARATDLDTITQRLTSQLISQDPSDSTVEGYMSTLQSNGSWSDINYANTAQTNWTPATHLIRLYDMAESYWNPSSSLYQSSTLEADIFNAYNYWISADPQSTNWYDNDIRTPQDLGQTAVLMRGELSATQLSEADTIFDRADAELNVPSIAQGTNTVNLALVGIDQGIIDSQSSDLTQAFAEIYSTVSTEPPGAGDAIQPDHTYQFHGPQLYEGDYGTSIIEEGLEYGDFAIGTSYAMTTAQEESLVDTLLDGTQWFIYGQALDFTASGRDLSRQGFATDGLGYDGSIEYALDLSSYRSTELNAFMARQNADSSAGQAVAAYGLTGNREFYDSGSIVQQRPNYYESVHVTSTRNINNESINGENLKGLYLADGVNQIMVTGNEYANIEPVWNWQRLPGITVEQNSRSLQPGSADRGSGTYAGGVSDNMYGAEALIYSRFNVSADKSWFFFNNEEVALGANINGPNTTAEVDTTLNQALLTGTVTYQTTGSTSPQTLTTGSVTPANLQWVNQGNIGYFFITPLSNALIDAQSQSGNWQAINSQYSNATVSSNVFTLYIDHGVKPSAASYSYIVVPNIAASAMAAYQASIPIQILRNDSTVQAVQQTAQDITEAAFYSASSFSIVSGQTVSANSPSMVMLNRQTNSLELVASSPQNLQMALQVQLAGVTLSGSSSTWFDAMGTSTVVFNLPGGNYAGSSIGLTLTSDGATTPTVSLTNTVGSSTLSYTVTDPVALANNTTFSDDANSSLAFTASISGTASLSKSGAGTLTLSGLNTYNGGTNIYSGSVLVNSTSNLGASTGALVLGTPVPATGGTTTATANLTLNASVTVSGFSSTSNNTAADTLTLAHGVVLTDTGPFTVGGINNTTNATIYTGALTATGGGSLVVSGSGSFNVGQTSNNTGGKDTTTVNLSGLNNINVNTTGTFGVGLGINSAGILALADTSVNSSAPVNFINATEIDIGNSASRTTTAVFPRLRWGRPATRWMPPPATSASGKPADRFSGPPTPPPHPPSPSTAPAEPVPPTSRSARPTQAPTPPAGSRRFCSPATSPTSPPALWSSPTAPATSPEVRR